MINKNMEPYKKRTLSTSFKLLGKQSICDSNIISGSNFRISFIKLQLSGGVGLIVVDSFPEQPVNSASRNFMTSFSSLTVKEFL